MPVINIPSDKPFESFNKIARVNKAFGCVITEKVDGTNGQIVIENEEIIAVGSRSRWISPGKDTDNFGFAGFVQDNYEELLKLGEGTHFGEWYGGSIQRGYGLKEKRFALFNAGRWNDAYMAWMNGHDNSFPNCCEVVPILYEGEFSREIFEKVMTDLKEHGSLAVSGYMNPEGIIVYLTGQRVLLKDTFEYRGGKWQEAA